MVDDVQGPLETTGGVGEEVGVIGDADSSDTVGPKFKAEFTIVLSLVMTGLFIP